MPDVSPMTALVTGADRGFGFCIARRLAEAGWRVYAGRVLPDYFLLDRLHNEFPQVIPLPLDVSSTDGLLCARETIGQAGGRLDLLVSNAAVMGSDGTAALGGEKALDFDALERAFCINSLAAPRLVDSLLPLLEASAFRRLFFTSSEISSIRLMRRRGDARYAMSKTALNLGVRMLFNTLRPRGFTFRLYQPGWMKRMLPDGSLAEGGEIDPDVSAAAAVRQILEDRPDEDRLVLTDLLGREPSF